jgi:hypothetical protein
MPAGDGLGEGLGVDGVSELNLPPPTPLDESVDRKWRLLRPGAGRVVGFVIGPLPINV